MVGGRAELVEADIKIEVAERTPPTAAFTRKISFISAFQSSAFVTAKAVDGGVIYESISDACLLYSSATFFSRHWLHT